MRKSFVNIANIQTNIIANIPCDYRATWIHAKMFTRCDYRATWTHAKMFTCCDYRATWNHATLFTPESVACHLVAIVDVTNNAGDNL
jgi:hypothetical protein